MKARRLACLIGMVLIAGGLSLPSVFSGSITVGNAWPLASLVFIHVAWCLFESMAESRIGRRRTPQRIQNNWLPTSLAAVTVLTVGLAAIAVADIHSVSGYLEIQCFVAISLASCGIVLRVLAIRKLGARFLDTVSIGWTGHSLECEGVFARCRHPAELGFLLILLGTVLVSGSVIVLLTWLIVVVPLVCMRTRLEDQMLVRHFGVKAIGYQSAVSSFGLKFV